MIAADKRQAVYLLHQDGMSLREIAHRLHLSRNTVRAILKQKGEMPPGSASRKTCCDGSMRTVRDGWSACTRSWWKKKASTSLTPPGDAALTSWAWVKVASSNAVTACPMWLGQKCNTTPAPIGSSWAPPPRC